MADRAPRSKLTFEAVVAALRIKRESTLQLVEAALARDRLREVLAAAAAVDAHAVAVELNALADKTATDRAWESAVGPALETLHVAVEAEDHALTREAIARVADALEIRSPYKRDDDVLGALADPSKPLVLGSRRRPRRGPPPDRILERLGPRVEAPPGIESDPAERVVGNRESFHERHHAGLHVLRPGAHGAAYDHHGVLLGDGTVVHFTGEAGHQRKSAARVRRQTLHDFLSGERTHALRKISLTALRGRGVATLRPNVICLRALSAIGRAEYSFLADNCEHFASWCSLGASHSSQTRFAGQLRRLLDADPQLEDLLENLASGDVDVRRSPVAGARSGDGLDPLVLDIGRAYWSPDADDFVTWIPFWSDDSPAPIVADHGWRLGALDGDLAPESWYGTMPVAAIDGEMHWCLVAIARGARDEDAGEQELYWLSQDGEWRRELRPASEIFEARPVAVVTLFEAMGRSMVEALGEAANAFRETEPAPPD